MTPKNAQRQVTVAIDTLTNLRNELGELLCNGASHAVAEKTDTRQLNGLHDKLSKAISAYHKG